MNKLKYTIDCIKRNYNLLGHKNECDAIDKSVVSAIQIFAKYYLDCTCNVCGLKSVCKSRLSKDCRYIHELQNELNKIEIIL